MPIKILDVPTTSLYRYIKIHTKDEIQKKNTFDTEHFNAKYQNIFPLKIIHFVDNFNKFTLDKFSDYR